MILKLTLLRCLPFALLLLHGIETWGLTLPMKAEAKKAFPVSFVTNLPAPFSSKLIPSLYFCLLLTYLIKSLLFLTSLASLSAGWAPLVVAAVGHHTCWGAANSKQAEHRHLLVLCEASALWVPSQDTMSPFLLLPSNTFHVWFA